MTLRTLTLSLLVLASASVVAWHDTGHRAVGIIAEKHLTAKAKEKVADLLKNLPSRDTPEFSFRPPDVFNDKPFPGVSGRFVAVVSSLEMSGPWPDEIRGTWMDRPSWHYINLPIVRDGGRAKNPPEINVVNAIPRLAAWIRDESRPREGRAAAIAWLNHLIGDVHMPLHAVALFDAQHPNGDRGGNDFFLDRAGQAVRENRLHAFWDGLPGRDEPKEIIDRIAQLDKVDLPSYPMDQIGRAAMDWALESKKIAEDWVYRVSGPGSDWLSTDQSQWRQQEYAQKCRPIADQRIQRAGIRLAAVLNAIFEN